MKVDIIIPIYNAYEYTVECLNSVLKYTDKNDYNLILINDKSPDSRIEDYLTELSNKKFSNILIYHNEENLGFVGTVNRGMTCSNNDVVLLNSDTEVTQGWLTKIKTAAYLNERIATVTPLTNSGTICSIPIFCEDNEIPNKFTVQEYADIIEKTSLKIYPSIPTAIGFCMYIKRKIINEVGLFDEKTFGKGYGEENDFCCRALENGYYHILCDDTFIYHKGSASFSKNKKAFIEKNLKTLFDRYPYYPKMIEKFIAKNPLKDIQDNVKLQIKLRNNKKNILYIVHNDFLKGENHPIGGTEFHVKDLIKNMNYCNSYVMFLKDNHINIHIFIDDDIIKLKFTLDDNINTFNFSMNSYRNKVDNILKYFNINLVHIHHLITHTFDVIDLAKKRDIPVFLTIHDFYLACPKVNFLYLDKEYCLNIRGKEACKKCIKSKFGYNEEFLKIWNERVYTYLQKINKIFTPSISTKKIFEEYYINSYGKFNLNIEVIEHGIDVLLENNFNRKLNGEKFKIGFIGGLSLNKGSTIIYDLITHNNNKKIEWHLFGNIGDKRLEMLERNDIIKHGRYERDDIVQILNDNEINLIGIFSIWPETYSYTLSEAIISKIPVIVTDIGALGERVRKNNLGWTVNYDAKYTEFLKKINDIIVNKEQYLTIYNKVKEMQFSSKSEVAKKYEDLYLENENRKLYHLKSSINKEFLLSYRINNMDMISQNGEDSIRIISELNTRAIQLEEELNLIKSTFAWKLIEFMKNRTPNKIKKLGKKIIYFCAKITKITTNIY